MAIEKEKIYIGVGPVNLSIRIMPAKHLLSENRCPYIIQAQPDKEKKIKYLKAKDFVFNLALQLP
jgi:hypothetical protein